MQAATAARRQALDAESAASAAHVEAEGALQRLVRTHRPGSPTVDDAVANLANRRSEYDQACEASVRVDTAYHEQQLEEVCKIDASIGRIMTNRSRQLGIPLVLWDCSKPKQVMEMRNNTKDSQEKTLFCRRHPRN
jgi:hypothetical protein